MLAFPHPLVLWHVYICPLRSLLSTLVLSLFCLSASFPFSLSFPLFFLTAVCSQMPHFSPSIRLLLGRQATASVTPSSSVSTPKPSSSTKKPSSTGKASAAKSSTGKGSAARAHIAKASPATINAGKSTGKKTAAVKGVTKAPTKKKAQAVRKARSASKSETQKEKAPADAPIGTPNVAFRAATGVFNAASAVLSGLKRRLSTAGN